MSNLNEKTKVFVAMSGGVDSSVAAALLKKQGFDVVGVFMKPPSFAQGYGGHSGICPWKHDREDAMKVAAKLGIPLLTWDFSKEYKKEVTDYMIREYKAGRTPNPDVMCNKEIKFGLFLKKALKEGADYIATGHYVRLVKQPSSRLPLELHSESSRCLRGSLSRSARTLPASPLNARFENGYFTYHLCRAVDENKDQSYFLWTLTQEQLKYCLFPIGDYTKPQVRRMAKKFGLSTADKKDSQGVCFIGPLNMKGFLQKYIRPKRGNIILLDTARSTHSGRVVGQHDGVYYYTIGQRHGLNITNGRGPYFVVRKDVKKNIIYVGTESNLGGKAAKVGNISWVNRQLKFPLQVDVKIRYRNRSERALLSKGGSLKFKNLTRAITPGQSAVFYKGDELLGGGIIK